MCNCTDTDACCTDTHTHTHSYKITLWRKCGYKYLILSEENVLGPEHQHGPERWWRRSVTSIRRQRQQLTRNPLCRRNRNASQQLRVRRRSRLQRLDRRLVHHLDLGSALVAFILLDLHSFPYSFILILFLLLLTFFSSSLLHICLLIYRVLVCFLLHVYLFSYYSFATNTLLSACVNICMLN